VALVEVAVAVTEVEEVIVAEEDPEHPAASVTVTVYVPAASPVTEAVVPTTTVPFRQL
jgi:hypothetical protein